VSQLGPTTRKATAARATARQYTVTVVRVVITPAAPVTDSSGLPIAEVSRQLGVPMPTLRSWELRYRIPASVRGAGKHRRYTAAEVHAVRLMRDQIARGTRAGLAAELVRDLLGVAGPPADYIADILAAAARSDPVEVREHLSRAEAALGLAACLDDVLLPAMQQIGLWWQTGRCDVDQEHLTTEAARAWLETLTAYAPPPTRPTPIVLACGPTDLHTIGLEALGVLLRHQHRTCRLLGARTSTPALTAAINATGAGAVVLVSHMNTGRQRAIQSLREASRLGAEVFYAGNAFTSPRSRRTVPGTYLGIRLQEACRIIDSHVE
jgi:MerR family transcriptional regulator, light-induced transcriptional regulator